MWRGRVSMDEMEGGDRCTNPLAHLTPFSLHSCLRVLLYGVRQTNRIGLPEWRLIEKGGAAVAPRN